MSRSPRDGGRQEGEEEEGWREGATCFSTSATHSPVRSSLCNLAIKVGDSSSELLLPLLGREVTEVWLWLNLKQTTKSIADLNTTESKHSCSVGEWGGTLCIHWLLHTCTMSCSGMQGFIQDLKLGEKSKKKPISYTHICDVLLLKAVLKITLHKQCLIRNSLRFWETYRIKMHKCLPCVMH